MTRDYLTSLHQALANRGIRGARRRRILAEFADHLSENPQADLGDPTRIAGQFADELGTDFARRAALTAFAALAVAGILVAIRFISLMPLNARDFSGWDTAAILVFGVAGQVSFVAGGLGLLRAWRLRHEPTISDREALILNRRAGIGLLFGAIAVAAFPLSQVHPAHAQPGSTWLWPAASVVGLVALAGAVPFVLRAGRVRPLASGPVGDVYADLGPLGTPVAAVTGGSANRLAVILAAVAVLVAAGFGFLADDGPDGVARGLVEALALLAGYGTLGRYLGLK